MLDHSPFTTPQTQGVDHLPIPDTTADLLDSAKVKRHVDRAIEMRRYSGSGDPEEYLLKKHCLVKVDGVIRATPAGILCFGTDPQAIYPRAVVDIGHYRGVEPISFEVIHLEKDIGGTIFDQLKYVEDYLWKNTHHGMTLDRRSLERVEIDEYPSAVIRELIANMLAHRDYTNHLSAARVQIFRNRVEWISPGSLPPGITVENILVGQASRNPALLTILYDAGIVEAIGQGLDTVVAVLAREGMEPPHFDDLGSFFMVTVKGRPPEAFTTGDSFTRLNDRQRKILAFIRANREVAPREVLDLLSLERRTLQRDIDVLETSNLIVVEGKGRGVRYRIIDVEV